MCRVRADLRPLVRSLLSLMRRPSREHRTDGWAVAPGARVRHRFGGCIRKPLSHIRTHTHTHTHKLALTMTNPTPSIIHESSLNRAWRRGAVPFGTVPKKKKGEKRWWKGEQAMKSPAKGDEKRGHAEPVAKHSSSQEPAAALPAPRPFSLRNGQRSREKSREAAGEIRVENPGADTMGSGAV